MKVLHLMESLNRGGAEMWELDVCRNASNAGIELTLVASGGGALEEEFQISGVEFIRLNRRQLIDLRLAVQIRRIIREREIAIIHANTALGGLLGYLATIGTDVKCVLSFHGQIPDKRNLWMSRRLFPRMDANIVGSNEFKTWLARDLKLSSDERIHVVRYGVDEARLRSDANTVRETLGLSSDALLFGMIANFYAGPRKDHLTVCRALPEVFRKFPNAHFIFVFAGGQDEDSAKYQACVEYCESEKISARVHFSGNRFSAKNVLQALDVFVLSSLHESFGIAAVEAMLVGRPCILSDIAPLIEISDGGTCASIFKRGDADDLAAKMVSLAESVDVRNQLGKRGQEFARAQFSIEVHLKGLKELYQSLI